MPDTPPATDEGSTANTSPRSPFGQGMIAALVMVPGVFPFGLITGVTALDVGYTIIETAAMNVLIYAGAAQLAAARMLADSAAVWVIVLTGCVINLRLLLYSAALSQTFAGKSWWQKTIAAYALTDQAYALSIAEQDARSQSELVSYYFGVATTMTITWHSSVAAGYFFGNIVPASLSLDFAVPLCFGALVLPHLKDPINLIVASIAASLSILLYGLPYNLGLVASGVTAIAIGYGISEWRGSVAASGKSP